MQFIIRRGILFSDIRKILFEYLPCQFPDLIHHLIAPSFIRCIPEPLIQRVETVVIGKEIRKIICNLRIMAFRVGQPQKGAYIIGIGWEWNNIGIQSGKPDKLLIFRSHVIFIIDAHSPEIVPVAICGSREHPERLRPIGIQRTQIRIHFAQLLRIRDYIQFIEECNIQPGIKDLIINLYIVLLQTVDSHLYR